MCLRVICPAVSCVLFKSDTHHSLAHYPDFERYVICHLNGMYTLSHRYLSVAHRYVFPNGFFPLKTYDMLYKLSVCDDSVTLQLPTHCAKTEGNPLYKPRLMSLRCSPLYKHAGVTGNSNSHWCQTKHSFVTVLQVKEKKKGKSWVLTMLLLSEKGPTLTGAV